MTDSEKIIRSALHLAAECAAEGTTAYDNFLIDVLKRDIESLCNDKAMLQRLLEHKIKQLAA